MRTRILAVLGAMLGLSAFAAGSRAEEALVKVGWCARTLTSAAAPFAIATKLGWYAQAGIKVQVLPLPGSSDCVKLVATGDLSYSLPSVEPLAIIRTQGVKAKIFYTAYQGNIYGIAVPTNSAIKSINELRGKKIGVTSMASGGVLVARALISAAGMNPDKDAQIVVAGEAAQTAALIRSHQVDALSQFDTQYALVENAGQPLRLLDTGPLAQYPSNGFLALEETLRKNRAQAVALVKGYAMGTVFAMANPVAAVKILYEVFPQTKPTGKSEAEALRDDVKTLEARAQHWKLAAGGVKRWGESSVANYDAYEDFLLKWGVIKQKIPATDLVTNGVIDDVNTFDVAKIAAEAKAYR